MTKDSWTALIFMAGILVIGGVGMYALSKGVNGTLLTAVVGAITAIVGFRVGRGRKEN